jgi:hypothetical protein
VAAVVVVVASVAVAMPVDVPAWFGSADRKCRLLYRRRLDGH